MHPKNYLNPEWETTLHFARSAYIVTCYQSSFPSSPTRLLHIKQLFWYTRIVSNKRGVCPWKTLKTRDTGNNVLKSPRSGSLESKHIRLESIFDFWLRWLPLCLVSVFWSHDNAIIVWCKGKSGLAALHMKKRGNRESVVKYLGSAKVLIYQLRALWSV